MFPFFRWRVILVPVCDIHEKTDDAMPEINLNTLAEIRIQEATELLKSIFGKYEKPPVERCVDMSGFAGPVPDDVGAAWEKSPWDYCPQDMEFIRHFFVLYSFVSGHEEHVRGMKYWLPRLLYGLSEGESSSVTDGEFIFQQMVWAKWLAWPAEEVEAVRQWCAAWLLAGIASGSEARSAAACINFAVDIGLDLTPTLYQITSDLELHEFRAIQDIVVQFAPQVIRRDKLDDESNPRATMLRALLKWMLNPATSDRLEQAFLRFAENDRKLATIVSETNDWIENVRKSYTADPRGLPKWFGE